MSVAVAPGKTTLLNLMGLLDRPTAGELLIEGEAVGNLEELGRARMRRERLGFIFQFHYLLPEFNVLENALMPCRIMGACISEGNRRSACAIFSRPWVLATS